MSRRPGRRPWRSRPPCRALPGLAGPLPGLARHSDTGLSDLLEPPRLGLQAAELSQAAAALGWRQGVSCVHESGPEAQLDAGVHRGWRHKDGNLVKLCRRNLPRKVPGAKDALSNIADLRKAMQELCTILSFKHVRHGTDTAIGLAARMPRCACAEPNACAEPAGGRVQRPGACELIA